MPTLPEEEAAAAMLAVASSAAPSPAGSASEQSSTGPSTSNNKKKLKRDRDTTTEGAAKTGSDSKGKQPKRKRIAACDVCRMRKVRCLKDPNNPSPDGRCQGCVELNRECSYLYAPRKPGPPNPYARPPPPQVNSMQQPAGGAGSMGRYGGQYPVPGGDGGWRAEGMGGSAAGSRAGYGLGHPPPQRSAADGSYPHNAGQRPPYDDISPVMDGEFDVSADRSNRRQYSMASGSSSRKTGGDMPTGYGLGGTMYGRPLQQHGPPHASQQHGQAANRSNVIDPALQQAFGGVGQSPSAASGSVASTSPDGQQYGLLPGGNGHTNLPGGGSNNAYGASEPAHYPSTSSSGLTPGTIPPTGTGHAHAQQARSGFAAGFSAEDNHVMPWIISAGGGVGHSSGLGRAQTGLGPYGVGSDASALDDVLGQWGGGDAASGGYNSATTGQGADQGGWGASNAQKSADSAGGPSAGRMNRASVSSSGVKESMMGPPVTSIEDVTSWSTVLTFLSLYHEHLYPLLPLMHWPSFSQQLISRADRKDPVLRGFLLSLVAYSILQLPRSVIPDQFTQQELVSLHQRCHASSRRLQPRTYDPLQLMHISTLYCDHIYLGSTGRDNAANVVLAEAMRLAIALGLHDESVAVQQGLDAIEQETRKRVFWSLYGSDRTIAALISCPMLLSDEDINVSDVLAVDDSLITSVGAFPQPADRTPILAGFMHVTRIFRLLSEVLTLLRRKARMASRNTNNNGGKPQTNTGADDGFPDPRSLVHSLQRLLDDLPPPLRLQSDVQQEPTTRTKAETNAFDTCRANILVSQVLVRFAIYQYAMLKSQGRADQCLDELTEDVLRRLHTMSSESLAANGESIRHKVLFIASSLLNKYPSDNAGHDHVSEFLNVYNKILLNQNKSGADDMDPVDQLPVPEGPYDGSYGA